MHFPQAFETKDPKCQYIALATLRETPYIFREQYIDDPREIEYMGLRKLGRTAQPWTRATWKYNSYLVNAAFWRKLLSPGYVPEHFKLFVQTFAENLFKDTEIDPSFPMDTEKFIQILVSNFNELRLRSLVPMGSNPPDTGLDLTSKDIEQLIHEGKISGEEVYQHFDLYNEFSNEIEIPIDLFSIPFTIVGNPIPQGTETWTLIAHDTQYLPVNIFKTRQELALYFVENNYDGIFDILRVSFIETHSDDEQGYEDLEKLYNTFSNEQLGSLEIFNNHLQENVPGMPTPLTKINLYKHFMENSYFEINDDEYRLWLIRQIQF